jgi:hypothetical protein
MYWDPEDNGSSNSNVGQLFKCGAAVYSKGIGPVSIPGQLQFTSEPMVTSLESFPVGSILLPKICKSYGEPE